MHPGFEDRFFGPRSWPNALAGEAEKNDCQKHVAHRSESRGVAVAAYIFLSSPEHAEEWRMFNLKLQGS